MKYVFRKRSLAIAASALDAVGYALLRRPSQTVPADVRTVLIVRLDHLGDIVLALGLPKAVKESFRKSRVIFLTSSWGAPLLENNPFVDETLVYDPPWFAGARYRRSPFSPGFAGIVRRIRERRVDVALAPRGDLRENAALFLAGARQRIGYGITGGGFFLTRELVWREGAHETEHLTAVLGELGIRSGYPPPRVYFSEEENRVFAAKARGEWGLAEGRDVGFHAEAGTPAKNWPIENRRRFFELFRERFPGRRLVLVGPRPSAGEDTAPAGTMDLRGRTALRELAWLASRLAAFVGPDSGPAHLASACGTPAVFLYSGTNEFARWRPLAENARVLRRPEVPCVPCHLDRCVVSGHPCLALIRAEEVLAALEEAGVR